ncbi:MAG: hypothetical protein MZV64_33715 [Ignavibacteriales bacterium]|nr:hypothetical protein [Ignavibacteriales bacterium]
MPTSSSTPTGIAPEACSPIPGPCAAGRPGSSSWPGAARAGPSTRTTWNS